MDDTRITNQSFYGQLLHLPATFDVRSASGFVIHALDSLPTATPTCDDATYRVDGSGHNQSMR